MVLEQDSLRTSVLPLVDPIIEINGLNKTLDCDHVVRNLSLQIGKNEIVGVLGKPGAGSHVMLDLLSGVLSPTSGRILFDGEDVTDMRHECRLRRGIARALPIRSIIPHFNVIENVLLHGNIPHKPLYSRQGNATDHEEALALLKLVGIADIADRNAGTLELHQKWLLTMAIALATHPLLLLLPVCNYNKDKTSAEVTGVIQRIAERGTSIILAAHAWHPIMEVCSRLEILRQGEIVTASAKTGTYPGHEILTTLGLDVSDLTPSSFSLRRFLKWSWFPSRMPRQSERWYSRSSDC